MKKGRKQKEQKKFKLEIKFLIIGILVGAAILILGAILIGEGSAGKKSADGFIIAAIICATFISGLTAYKKNGPGAVPTAIFVSVIYCILLLMGTLINPDNDENSQALLRNLLLIFAGSLSGTILKLYITGKKHY